MIFLPFLAANDGDSVIIVHEQKGKKQETSRLVFVFVSLDVLSLTVLLNASFHCSNIIQVLVKRHGHVGCSRFIS